MSIGPNSEQLVAIQHQGGVLLKAGAGSGKTFVLVEHIVYLTKIWIEEKGRSPDFEAFIKEKYSQVVMMTFTNKAAGEMKLRLFKKFDEITLNTNDKSWEVAREYLTWLTVTTIDGFCRKLITSGHFPHLVSNAEIIFEEQRTSQVESILEDWFSKNIDFDPDIRDQIVKAKEDIKISFCKIFNDPSKRKAWREFSRSIFDEASIDKIISHLFDLNNVAHFLVRVNNYDVPGEDANGFEKGLIELFQKTGLPEVRSYQTLLMYEATLPSRAPALTAKIKTPELEAISKSYKDFKDWVVDLSKIIKIYFDNKENKILPWFESIYKIYEYVDTHLGPIDGFTFGDIEYYVSLGLENKQTQEKINSQYRYFIVDEFQDTSLLQFDIIKKLIDNDFNKLFCVGDAKQAIYGFRGGELKVFEECTRLIPKNLKLSHNYRSLKEIIETNNSIFDHILPVGYEFIGIDPYTVDFEPQTIPPIDYKGDGEIIINSLDLSNIENDKIKNEQLNQLESKVIADQVEILRRDYPDKQNTILYKKLDPSTDVIRHLMSKGIGFTAQFKIQLLDDPILGIFYYLLKYNFDVKNKTKDEFTLNLIENYLTVLGTSSLITNDVLTKFQNDILYFGVLESFKKFLFSLNITNENSDLNLGQIELLCLLYDQNLAVIYSRLTKSSDNKISMDLRWGKDSEKVLIMSAHASKGLEFDHVILGGIFTNAGDISNKNFLGDNPESFYWYDNFQESSKITTPYYQYDREISRYKNFSESKRLLYVACTRAVDKLIWVSLNVGHLQKKIKQNSWSVLLDDWLMKTAENKITNNVLDNADYIDVINNDREASLPLFYYDSVGVVEKKNKGGDLLIVPELSVTRLNSLLSCPRKFYLENVLKMTADEKKTFHLSGEEEELATVMSSSAERGTALHKAISVGISRHFLISRDYLGSIDEALLEKVFNRLSTFSQDYELISEVPLKFSFFGHVISGTPDLILLPKQDKIAQVWDFKTGRISESKVQAYWLQLKVYAYALWILNKVSKNNSIKLELYFIDEDKFLTLEVQYESIAQELMVFWSRQSRPWERNLEHCKDCHYGDICLR